MESNAQGAGGASDSRFPTFSHWARSLRKLLRLGWPQSFALGHLMFLVTMAIIIYSTVDPFGKIGLSMIVIFVDFAVAPLVVSGGGIYQSYVAVGAVLVLGTLQWSAIGWCVGYLFRKTIKWASVAPVSKFPPSQSP